jgi:hypothetical protein
MRKITNQELIDSLSTATEQDKIDWTPTGVEDQYTASFGGKWTLLIDKSRNNRGEDVFFITMKDSAGQTILKIYAWDDERIPGLYEMARRCALKIDEALADLLKEIDKSQK